MSQPVRTLVVLIICNLLANRACQPTRTRLSPTETKISLNAKSTETKILKHFVKTVCVPFALSVFSASTGTMRL